MSGRRPLTRVQRGILWTLACGGYIEPAVFGLVLTWRRSWWTVTRVDVRNLRRHSALVSTATGGYQLSDAGYQILGAWPRWLFRLVAWTARRWP